MRSAYLHAERMSTSGPCSCRGTVRRGGCPANILGSKLAISSTVGRGASLGGSPHIYAGEARLQRCWNRDPARSACLSLPHPCEPPALLPFFGYNPRVNRPGTPGK